MIKRNTKMMVVTLFIAILASVGTIIWTYILNEISFITFEDVTLTLIMGFLLGLLTQMAYYKYLQDMTIEVDKGGHE